MELKHCKCPRAFARPSMLTTLPVCMAPAKLPSGVSAVPNRAGQGLQAIITEVDENDLVARCRQEGKTLIRQIRLLHTQLTNRPREVQLVDRSAAYAARQLARSLVDADLAAACEVRVAYAIGVPRPVAVHVDTAQARHGLRPIDSDRLLDLMRPASIIQRLGLRRPIFRETPTFGHFARDDFLREKSVAGVYG